MVINVNDDYLDFVLGKCAIYIILILTSKFYFIVKYFNCTKD